MADQDRRPSRGRRGPSSGAPRRGPSGPTPLEQSVRSTRNALGRHAESLRDPQAGIACRGIMVGVVGATKTATSPAEVLGMVEQVLHVLEAGPREDSQLPTVLRAVVHFAREASGRERAVKEMIRLLLRHGYSLAADHIPRQVRDDGSFRASTLQDALKEVGALYVDDETFSQGLGR